MQPANIDELLEKLRKEKYEIKCNLSDKIQKRQKPDKAGEMRIVCGNSRYIGKNLIGKSEKSCNRLNEKY